MSDYWVSAEWLQRLAGSLLHFLWQGALLAFLAAVLLRLLARRPAVIRYNVAAAALGLMLLAPCVTIVFYPETGAASLRVLRFLSGWAESVSMSGPEDVARWTGWIVTLWAAGVVVCSTRLLAAWLLSLRLIRSSQTEVPASLERLMQRVRSVLLTNGPAVKLRIGERVDGPVVFGWLRPVVLLPATAITGLSEDHLLAVLAHELAHVRRHDFLVNMVQRGVESVLFYHPAVWWLSARVRAERENCCDDLAAGVCEDRFAYAQALIELERTRVVEPAFAIPAASGRLAERIRRLLGVENANRDWQPATVALLLLAVCAVAGVWQTDTIASPVMAPAAPLLLAGVESVAAPASAPLEGARSSMGAIGAMAAIATAQTQQRPPTGERWVTTWGATLYSWADQNNECCNDQTLRMFMRASIGGRSVRIRLSNTYGTTPLFFGQVRVAQRAQGSEIVAGSDRLLSFGGKAGVEIPVGETVTSDPVTLTVPALADLTVSIYAPNQTGRVTGGQSQRSGYTVSGDQARSIGLTGGKLTWTVFWVSDIEVLAPANAGVVVIAGGTNVLGEGSTREANRSWPSLIAARLQSSEATRGVAVVVNGKVHELLDAPSFPDAFDRLVASHSGVRQLILCAEFPPLSNLAADSQRQEAYKGLAPADRLIRMLTQVINQARARNVSVIGCTMSPPSEQLPPGNSGSGPGIGRMGQEYEAIRVSVNEWMRSSGAFDGLVDLDAMTRDAAHYGQLKPGLVDGRMTYLLNDRGHKAIADAMDLSLFRR